MIERLPCKPAPTSHRILIEWCAFCLLLAFVLYVIGA